MTHYKAVARQVNTLIICHAPLLLHIGLLLGCSTGSNSTKKRVAL